jgi:hypothetical protein
MKSKIYLDEINPLRFPEAHQPPMSYLQISGLDIIKSSLGLLDKHSFALSRAALIAGDQDISPDLSELSYDDIRLLQSNLNRLVGILRGIHEHVLQQDPDLSKEVLIACSEAILRKADVVAARRIFKSESSVPILALISATRASLLRIKSVIRKTGGSISPVLPGEIPTTDVIENARLESVNFSTANPKDVTNQRDKEPTEIASPKVLEEKTTLSVEIQSVVSSTGEPRSTTSHHQNASHSADSDDRVSEVELESTPKPKFTLEDRQRPFGSVKHKTTLHERFAALRKATAVVPLTDQTSQRTSSHDHSTPPSKESSSSTSTRQKRASTIEGTRAGSECEAVEKTSAERSTATNSELAEDGMRTNREKVKAASHKIKTVDRNSGLYLKESSKHRFSKANNSTESYDIIEFTVINAENRPVSQLTWNSKGPKNFIKKEESARGLVRRHVAEKLNADPRSLGLFFNTKSFNRARIQVRIMLDPYIRLTVGPRTFVLDFSRTYFNKARLTVGELREQAASRIAEERQHSIHLFINLRPLRDDAVRLKDTGLLSDKVLDGWEPLIVQATVEIEVKDCVVCGDDLPFHKFPIRITSACDHPEVNTCRKCLRTWIKTTLASRGWDKIGCPECNALLQHNDIKARASKRTFEK